MDQLVVETMKRMPYSMRISWSDYADLRTGGLTHEQISNIQTDPNGRQLLEQASQEIMSLIDWRIEKVLALSDI